MCTSSSDLLEAARVAAEYDVCLSLQGPGTCAQGGRSAALRRQVPAMHQAASVLRGNVQGLALKALRRGPPAPSPAQLVLQAVGQQPASSDGPPLDAQRWPGAVAELQAQVRHS